MNCLNNFKKKIQTSVAEWTEDEKEILTKAIKILNVALDKINVRPTPWKLIKVNGYATDGSAFYTRGGAIIVPESSIIRHKRSNSSYDFIRTLAHESFHIYSRFHPEKRRQLYKLLGFNSCKSIDFGHYLLERKISNPDIEDVNQIIELNDGNKKFYAVLFDYSRYDSYQPLYGGLFNYMVSSLFEVEPIQKNSKKPIEDQEFKVVLTFMGKPKAIPLSDKSFLEKIGTNTSYVTNAEEIMAENVAILAMTKLAEEKPYIDFVMEEVITDFALLENIAKILI